MFAMTLAVALVAASPEPPPTDARQVTLAAPLAVTELDSGKTKGEPSQLAWSPDGSELYLQMTERDSSHNVKSAKHFVVAVANKAMKGVDGPPAWAGKYWTWKSGQASPGAPAFKINVDTRQETKRAVSAPTGGALARGGTDGGDRSASGTTAGDAAAAVYASQPITIYTLKLKGEPLGEWTNEPVTPGVNFGWAPAPSHLIAYAKRDGGPIIVLDDEGHKQELTGARNAVLPAWSDDGTKLAWLEKKDRKKFDVMIAGVATK
jgi:hypothetical protein